MIRLGIKQRYEDEEINKYDKRYFEENFGLKCGSNIGVTGTGKQIGTSLFAVMLAGFLGRLGFDVCYTECGLPRSKSALLFDSFAMDQRFSGKGYVDFYELLSKDERVIGISNAESLWFGQGQRKTSVSEEGKNKPKSGAIDWRLISQANVLKNVELNKRQFSRFQSAARGDYNIFDIDSTSDFDFLHKDMDELFVVASPLPSRMIREAERIKYFKLLTDDVRVTWVVNHMNDGVSKREVKKIFRTDKIIFIDEIATEILYACEYKCAYPWEDEACRKAFWGIFTKASLR